MQEVDLCVCGDGAIMGGETAALFESLRPLVDSDVVAAVGAVYQFDVTDDAGNVEHWTLDLANGEGEIVDRAASECRPGVVIGATFELTEDTLGRLFRGELDPMSSILFGRLRFTGSKRKAAKIQMLFNRIPPCKPAAGTATAAFGAVEGLLGWLRWGATMLLGRPHHTPVGQYRADFAGEQHAKYFERFITMVPEFLSSQDTNRLTLVFFSLAGLDLLGQLDAYLDAQRKRDVIDWIYSLMVPPASDGSDSHGLGFRGGTFLGDPFCAGGPACGSSGCGHQDGDGVGPDAAHAVTPTTQRIARDGGHLAMTYTGLACLKILGDDLSRMDRHAMARSLRHFQRPDGSVTSTVCEGENDMRFLYCACCAAYMLDDWSGIDVAAATGFVARCINYDGGIGQAPGLESHGGSTFCALASLWLMGTFDDVLTPITRRKVLHWLINRQMGKGGGFQGRPHKAIDTCYSFWVGSSLHLLGFGDLADAEANRAFLMTTQNSKGGGFAKWPDTMADPLHAYMGISGLALQREQGLAAVHPALNFSRTAAAQSQSRWRGPVFAAAAVALIFALRSRRP